MDDWLASSRLTWTRLAALITLAICHLPITDGLATLTDPLERQGSSGTNH